MVALARSGYKFAASVRHEECPQDRLHGLANPLVLQCSTLGFAVPSHAAYVRGVIWRQVAHTSEFAFSTERDSAAAAKCGFFAQENPSLRGHYAAAVVGSTIPLVLELSLAQLQKALLPAHFSWHFWKVADVIVELYGLCRPRYSNSDILRRKRFHVGQELRRPATMFKAHALCCRLACGSGNLDVILRYRILRLPWCPLLGTRCCSCPSCLRSRRPSCFDRCQKKLPGQEGAFADVVRRL
eukprot:TRINITY_DN103036_c0_g1_i1.p1 TRINITY_DN103036_c0_g1~~TRINITY_DN103036_c0_g1_i1.p1  ORF type:complete len:241 (+),score=18.08 TRINITY_DN103036_c0_g1_i1:484-1206(+)